MTIVGLAPELSTILLFLGGSVGVVDVIEVVVVVFVEVVDVVVEAVVLVQGGSIARSHGLLEDFCVREAIR